MIPEHQTRIAVIGGGPAGNTTATIAAALGAHVTLVEDKVIGGAANLWDCIPSKAMVASALRLAAMRGGPAMGVPTAGDYSVDMAAMSARADGLTQRISAGLTEVLDSQGVDLVSGRARFSGAHEITIERPDAPGAVVEFDRALIATGSRPWVPDWAEVDGERVLTTRDAYHLPEVPEHMVVVGSGVTGVEFVHIFAALGSRVTLLVSRQQVLPHRDPEVAAVLEEDFLSRGVSLLKGGRADGITRDGDAVRVTTTDGRSIEGSHVLLAVGSRPNTEGLGLEVPGVVTDGGYIGVDDYQRTNVAHIYAAGDVTGQMPLSSVASMQGRKIARHAMGLQVTPLDYSKVSQAIFTEPEIASVGLEEADARAEGRKVRITKVPFAANPRALIQANPTGFVKVISDPATHVVLGGTIVGHHASELIGILAVAAQGHLRVDTLVETLMVHPSLTESLADAAD